jgi:hypothetical protein
MVRRGLWAGAVLSLGLLGADAKTGTPGPAYFAGSYDMVGQSAGGALISGPAQILPQGGGVVIRACTLGDISLGFGPAFEVVNLMTGSMPAGGAAADAVECLFHNNGYNRPILTCRSTAGAAFTLWPTPSSPQVCGA